MPPAGVAVTVNALPAGCDPVSRNSEKMTASVRPRTSALCATGAALSSPPFTLWSGSLASPACSRTALTELSACATIVPPFSSSVSRSTARPAGARSPVVTLWMNVSAVVPLPLSYTAQRRLEVTSILSRGSPGHHYRSAEGQLDLDLLAQPVGLRRAVGVRVARRGRGDRHRSDQWRRPAAVDLVAGIVGQPRMRQNRVASAVRLRNHRAAVELQTCSAAPRCRRSRCRLKPPCMRMSAPSCRFRPRTLPTSRRRCPN